MSRFEANNLVKIEKNNPLMMRPQFEALTKAGHEIVDLYELNGSYSPDNLLVFFQTFRSALSLQNFKSPVFFILENENHFIENDQEILVVYNVETNKWIFAKNLFEKEMNSDEQLVRTIKNIMGNASTDDDITLKTTVYSTEAQYQDFNTNIIDLVLREMSRQKKWDDLAILKEEIISILRNRVSTPIGYSLQLFPSKSKEKELITQIENSKNKEEINSLIQNFPLSDDNWNARLAQCLILLKAKDSNLRRNTL